MINGCIKMCSPQTGLKQKCKAKMFQDDCWKNKIHNLCPILKTFAVIIIFLMYNCEAIFYVTDF